MDSRNRFIAPERVGIWLMVAFGLAVLALITAIWGVRESRATNAFVQLEILKLSDRIKAQESKPAAMPAAPAEPAMPAEPENQ